MPVIVVLVEMEALVNKVAQRATFVSVLLDIRESIAKIVITKTSKIIVY